MKNNNSKLILGTVQMGMNYGVNNNYGKIPISECFNILDYAYEHGINSIDTAEGYGDAHSIIGEYHVKSKNKFKINTKFSSGSNLDIDKKVNNYLKQLNINCIEVIMFHNLNSYKNNQKNIDLLKEIKCKGLIKKVGVSVYRNEEIDSLLDDDDIDVIQLPFNLLDNDNLRLEKIKKAKSRGKVIHTRSVFLQGMFFMDSKSENMIYGKLKKYLSQINSISIASEIPILNLALGYCLQHNKIDGVLIGVDSLNQLKSNINAITQTLNHQIIDQINKINVHNKELLNPTNW